MKLTLLGTGSPIASDLRASTGHLIETGTSKIVVDLGPGACRRLLRAGHQPFDVTHIFLTHLHFDHVGDIPSLLFYIWEQLAGIRSLPPIYGPTGTRRMVERLFGPNGAFSTDIHARTHMRESLEIYTHRGGVPPRPRPVFDVEEFADLGWTQGDRFRVGHFPVLHAQPYLDSFGYRIEAEGAVIAISSDIAIAEPGYGESLVPIAQDADILVHYLNHLAFEPAEEQERKEARLAEAAARLGVRQLVTTHHGPRMDSPGVAERVVAGLRRRFSGDITWGEDLLSFDVAGQRHARAQPEHP